MHKQKDVLLPQSLDSMVPERFGFVRRSKHILVLLCAHVIDTKYHLEWIPFIDSVCEEIFAVPESAIENKNGLRADVSFRPFVEGHEFCFLAFGSPVCLPISTGQSSFKSKRHMFNFNVLWNDQWHFLWRTTCTILGDLVNGFRMSWFPRDCESILFSSSQTLVYSCIQAFDDGLQVVWPIHLPMFPKLLEGLVAPPDLTPVCFIAVAPCSCQVHHSPFPAKWRAIAWMFCVWEASRRQDLPSGPKAFSMCDNPIAFRGSHCKEPELPRILWS